MNESIDPHNSSDELLHLKQQMLSLDERVERIELKLQLAPQPKATAPATIFAPKPVPEVPRPSAAIPPSVPSFAAASAPIAAPISASYIPGADQPEHRRGSSSFALSDWENLIGGKWALWIGSLCLFLAMASFLAYTWSALPPTPPWARVTMGMLSGFALIGGGAFLRPRSKRYFSEGLSGAGLSICYLSLWAGSQYFSLFSPLYSFVGMIALTALGVGLALRYDALSLSVLSTLGGFLTPVLVGSQGGSGSAIPFLTYVALLNTGILAVSLGKRWRGLVWLSFVCTLLLVTGWSIDVNIENIRASFLLFTTLTFAQYIGAATFYSLIRREETASEDLLLLFASTSLYTLVGYNLAEPLTAAFPAAFPLALALFFGLLNLAVRKVAPANAALRNSTGGLALLAVTIAVPLQLRRAALTIGWVVEAAILVGLGGKLKSPLLRRAGQLVWLLTAVPLFQEFTQPISADSGLVSTSAFPLAVCTLVSALLCWNARRLEEKEAWPDQFEPGYAIAAVAGGAWLLAQEIYRAFELHHSMLSTQWIGNAYLTIASVLAVYSLAIFALGLKAHHEVARWCALALTTAIACMGLFSSYSAAVQPTAPKVAQYWPTSVVAFVCIGATLAILTALLRNPKAAISEMEKESAHAWMCGTILFLLTGASLHLFSAFSIYRALFGPQWIQTAVYALTMFWFLAVPLLLKAGCQWRDEWMRCLALLTGAGAVATLLLNAISGAPASLPFFNWRVACFGVAIIATQLSIKTLRRHADNITPWERELPSTLKYLSLFLLLWALTQESYEASRYYREVLGENWRRQAQMAVSLVWSVFGAMLLLGGIRRREQPLRLAALGLLAATVVKVFIFDLSFLDGLPRILSLGGLGVSLIFISWLYSRFGTEKLDVKAPPEGARRGTSATAENGGVVL